jgi:hypothetical protein
VPTVWPQVRLIGVPARRVGTRDNRYPGSVLMRPVRPIIP